MRPLLLALLLALLTPAVAQADPPSDSTGVWDRLGLEAYGTVNYFAYDWATDPARNNAVDLERFVLYPSYQFSERISMLGEIEFEHGGTGVTKEIDKFEEFGEFENEIESGGEVVLEQLNVRFALHPLANIRVGQFKIPIGLAAVNDEPTEYFATTRAETEAAVIPTNWYEIGVQVEGRTGALAYSAALVNGLNSAEFSAANWIVRGNESKFETIAADNFAFTARADYYLNDESFIGASVYTGDSADNRRKSTLSANGQRVNARVTVADVHAQYLSGPVTLRGLVLYGRLQNADVVTTNNRTLSSNLNAKGTPVGSAALGYRIEAGYDLLSFTSLTGPQRLDIFGRYSFYDTHYETTGSVTDDPLWERTVYTGGLNFRATEGVVLKAEYSHRTRGRGRSVSGSLTGDTENTFSLGLGFQF